MIVKHAEYLISSPSIDKCPEGNIPEYAFIGRSNVGKSTLINKLANKKNLARTSATPGKTIMINHFSINNNQMYWVDLPGFGYAKRSKKMIGQLENMIYTFLKNRSNLLTSFVLIDSRHSPQNMDIKFINWCGTNEIPIALIFTKIDKQKESITEQNIRLFQERLLANWEELPLIFRTSAIQGTGISEILDYMDYTNKLF
ncbi:MAG: ribosome biogenesis GTP-binding protein YihA/YsxC [Bacteroidales bacterium]|nr:ribosome biogenesis GTP-binding protein YihA/YsxC [Bacteroidales bacterium]